MKKKGGAGMSARERTFCRLYAYLQNPWDAARTLGYAPEEFCALLGRHDIQAETGRLLKGDLERLEEEAIAGLRRIAFCRRNDAVKLVMQEETGIEALDDMDLFGLAELRRPKGGGWELKFYDRAEALRLMLDCAREGPRRSGNALLEALEKSAASMHAPGQGNDV